MVRKLLVLLAWVSLGYIVYVTLSPIGLRPVASHNPAYERLVAYAIVGILFGLAYRGRAFMALGIVVGAAIALEGLQYLTPDRHGQLWTSLRRHPAVCSECWLRLRSADTWFALSAITNEPARLKFPQNPHAGGINASRERGSRPRSGKSMGFCADVERFTGQLKLYYSKIGRGLILNFQRTLVRRAAPSAVSQSGFIRGIPDE